MQFLKMWFALQSVQTLNVFYETKRPKVKTFHRLSVPWTKRPNDKTFHKQNILKQNVLQAWLPHDSIFYGVNALRTKL